MKTPEDLLKQLSLHGGAVVSTSKLSPVAIAVARMQGRMYVGPDNLGFVWQPPAEAVSEMTVTPAQAWGIPGSLGA